MFFRKKHSEVVALIDISSLSIGVGYAVLSKTQAPILCYTTRIPLSIPDGGNAKAYLQVLQEGLTQATTELTTTGAAGLSRACGVRAVDRVLVSVGSTWQRTYIHTHEESYSRPERVTHELLDSIKKKIEEQLEINRNTVRCASHDIVDVTINGYRTTNPLHAKAQRVAVTTMAGVIPLQVYDQIASSVEQAFHQEAAHTQSMPAISHTVLRDVFAYENDFLGLIVTGESTDIVLAKDGVLVGIENAAVGVHTLQQDMARESHDSTSSVDSAILHPKDMHHSIKQKAHQRWLAEIMEALERLSKRHALPQTIFTVADPTCEDVFSTLLRTQDMHTVRRGEKPFTVIPIQTSHLSDFVVITNAADPDVLLGFLAIWSSKKKVY